MSLTKLFLVFLVLFVLFLRTYFAGITINTSGPEKHEKLANAAVEILTSCYRNQGHAVVLAGSSAGNLSRILWTRLHIPITILDDEMRVVRSAPVTPQTSHRLQVFVVTALSAKALLSTMKYIKDSPWWNHMASVLILDWSLSNQGCMKALGILKNAWQMNLINAKFICLDRAKRTLIYNYNPYTSQAPHPWQMVITYRSKADHPWTLFAQRYRQEDGICDELDFVKTNDLTGCEIRVLVKNISGVWSTYPNKNGTAAFGKLDGRIARILFYALRATPKVVTQNNNYSIPLIVRDNKTVGGSLDVKNGIFDMCLNPRFPDINSTLSWVVRESGIVAMTQYRGQMSQLSKIVAVLDVGSRIGLLIVAVITLFFFKFVIRLDTMPAFLNVWRIYCNSCIPNVPKAQAPRLYLVGILLFMLNIQAIYQGKMAALVTTKVAIRDVQTTQELNEYGFTVYGSTMVREYYDDIVFAGGFVTLPYSDCTPQVLKDYWAACLREKFIQNYNAAKFKQHVSEEPILKLHRMYIIRPDWPLEDKINKIVATIVETGIVQASDKAESRKILHKIQLQKDLDIKDFKVMTLGELAFAFSLLGVGLLFAIVTFIVELCFGRVRSWITKARDVHRRKF